MTNIIKRYGRCIPLYALIILEPKENFEVRSEVLTAMVMEISIFWNIILQNYKIMEIAIIQDQI
jgi:hypothetical protein